MPRQFLFSLLIILTSKLFATGLQPLETNQFVRMQAVDFKLTMQGPYVAGLMEIQLIADKGSQNAANLRFPLPPQAVLHQAEIFLPRQEQWVTAETLGRREGQAIYDSIVQQKYDPLLIQRIGTDFYRARVYPITPDGALRLRIHYAHLLETTETGYRLRIPFANKDATAATPTDGLTVTLQTQPNYWTAGAWKLSEAFGEMTTPVDLSQGTTSLSFADFKMEKDLTLDLTPKTAPKAEAVALSYQPTSPLLATHWYLQWQPNFTAYHTVASQARNVVFVIDVSGSMTGAKIAQTRKAIITCLEALKPEDTFGLVAFDSKVYSFQDNMYKGTDIQAAIRWVTDLAAGSNTGMAAALAKGVTIATTSAIKEVPIDLLLITDGRPNVGSSTVNEMLSEIGAIAEQVGRQIRIFTVGIGEDLDQALLNGLAQQTGGEATFALKDNEITGQILELFERVRAGGVSQVNVTVAGTPPNEFTWSRLFPGDTLQLATKGNFNGTLTFHGTAMMPIELSVTPVDYSNPNFNQIAAPLAAKSWADQLERQIDAQGETLVLVNQAVKLARTYGIVTRYSSLLALESDDLYTQYGVKRVERDPAGIALQPIEEAKTDESQVGGQGTVETPTPPPPPWREPGPIIPFAPQVAAEGTLAYDKSATPASPATAGKADTTVKDENNSMTVAAENSCASPSLNAQLRLSIPQLTYAGNYYWAELQLINSPAGFLVLEVLDYGKVAHPNLSGCQEVFLSATLRLYLPEVVYHTAQGEKLFSNVILKALPGTTLKFKVFDFTLE